MARALSKTAPENIQDVANVLEQIQLEAKSGSPASIAHSLLSSLVSEADAIVLVDAGGILRFCSSAIRPITGCEPATFIDEGIEMFVDARDVEQFRSGLENVSQHSRHLAQRMDVRLIHDTSKYREVRVRARILLLNLPGSERGHGFLVMLKDVSERSYDEAVRALRRTKDELTGLSNREHFLDQLQKTLIRRKKTRGHF